MENEHHDFIAKEGEIKIKPPYYYLTSCVPKFDPDFFDLFEMERNANSKLSLEIIYTTISDITINSSFNIEITAQENNVIFKFLKFEKS